MAEPVETPAIRESAIDGARLDDLCRRLPAGDEVNVRLHLGQRAPDAELRVPGTIGGLGVDLDGVSAAVVDQHTLARSS